MSDPASETQRAALMDAPVVPHGQDPLARRLEDFRPTSYFDFGDPDTRARMEAALRQVESELGRTYPMRIGGEDVRTERTRTSVNPGAPEQIVGVFPEADAALADRAVRTAAAAFETWRKVPASERSEIVFRAADIMRRRRMELAAWMCFEVGKSWGEADGDVAEAIDFCEYYARLNLHHAYDPYPVVQIPGEENRVVYLPLGVGAVIPPWNFPLAILAGMTTAALVTGNTVVLKPASESMTIGWKFMEVLEEAGLPDGVVNFLTGPGEVVGRRIVEHPLVRFVSFTGSRDVGVEIYERASQVVPEQRWLKRVVAEMGGKDAIVVDSEADVDAAVEGVALSAFGYQGQKCSACSRAIVVDEVYDEFLRKLVRRADEIRPGSVTEGAWMGPVASRSQFRKVKEYIDIGKGEGTLVLGGKADDANGYFVQPTIFADVAPDARIAREEIFGPVLAVVRARDFDDALAIANDTDYGLTGAVYTKNPDKIKRAEEEFHVGNLYINRKCTGALVGVHPFGGFNMSGTDSKAGGKDYLLLFLQPKSIARKKD